MASRSLEYVGVKDVDGTMFTNDMEHGRGTPAALAAAHFVRDFYRNKNGIFAVATAQSTEMLMSSKSFEASVQRGFSRPRPLLGGVPGDRFYVRPEDIPCRVPFTDADAIMSMGTGCHVRRQKGWYAENVAYRKRLGLKWRAGVLRLLDMMNENGVDNLRQYFAPIEFEENYRLGKTDVMPLEFRIQFEFVNAETKNIVKGRIEAALTGLIQLSEIKGITNEMFTQIISQYGDILRNLRIVDESDPLKNKFQFYLMPRYAAKEEMIDEMLAVLTQGQMIGNLLIAGDMPPDLLAGCFAGRALSATFLLVGGSPVSPYLTRDDPHFGMPYAGERLQWMTDELMATKRPGFEVLHRAGIPARMVVIGDIAYPGTTGPETIAAFLKDEHKPRIH